MSSVDELLTYIFDGKTPNSDFVAWVKSSRNFKAFAITYQSKIKNKLKNARDEGSITDVYLELATAELLLREPRFTLEYEKNAALRQRAPDFTVTFKTHTPFNLEVRRIRTTELDESENDALGKKLIAVLCDKVGQMPPSIVNFLLLVTENEITEAELNRAVSALRHRAESKDEAFFKRRGFETPAAFLKQYSQLSSIILRHPAQSFIWINNMARHKPSPEIVLALQRLENTLR